MKWKELTKIGITGSRKFAETGLVVQYLERYVRQFDSIDEVIFITGGAIGVDWAAESLCMKQGIKNLIIAAKWIALEKAAGPIRNKEIVNMSNEMLAFWDGISPGTKQCIEYAQSVNKPIKIFNVHELRKELKVPEPVKIFIPESAKQKDARQIRDLVDGADLKNFFTKEKVVRPLKVKDSTKKKIKWMRD